MNKYHACTNNINGKLITVHAQKLVDDGFEGNGCGSGFLSSTICSVLQWFIGADLSQDWLYHDAEYTIDGTFKSIKHREIADSNLYFNLLHSMGIDATKMVEKKTFKHRFAKWIHAALTLKGDDAYKKGS